MLILQTRRMMYLIAVACLSLGLFSLFGGRVQAAQTSTVTPASSDTPGVSDTPGASDTTALADTPVPSNTPAAPSTRRPSATPAGSASPEATNSSQNDIWSAPTNLSRSGAALAPVIAAETNGSLDALWWDKFEGTKYANYSPDKGWSKPVTVGTIFGSRLGTNSTLGPPSQLRLLVDSSRGLHAFWIDAKGNLLYAQSRAGTGNSFTTGLQLATTPLAWDVTLDGAGSLHLAYIRPGNNAFLPSGVYYRSSNNSGLLWENVSSIVESPYFRTLDPSAAHVNVASNGKGVVLVAWDDPQLKRTFFAQSQNGGRAFAAPVKLPAADVIQNDSVQRARFVALSNGQFLRLWQAGENCALYQQQSDEKVQQWSIPQRVLDNLGGCPSSIRATPMGQGQLFVSLVLDKRLALTIWDGQAWAPPRSARVSFVNPVTNRSTALGCIDPTLVGDQLALIGCDDNQDVWSTVSVNGVAQLLPALTTAWSPPTTLAAAGGDASLPAVAAEASGRMHLMWSQTSADNGPSQNLMYVRGDGVNWTAPVGVLSSPAGGKAQDPALLADQTGSLHAAWSGGFAGQVYYSHAFIRDAANSGGWSSPVLLPAPIKAGNSPALAVDTAGMHILYAIPLNEARGIYEINSTDQGTTWSAAKEVFDAAAAGWPMVTDARLLVDRQNRLQATWVQRALPPATTSLGIYYSRSRDGGRTWSDPVQISGVDTGSPVLVATGPDELHLLWTANLSGQAQLWHQWSNDGGATWSKGTPLLQLRNIAPGADLATDGAGALYLVSIEQTPDNSAALSYLRWNGATWAERETLPLGYTTDAGSGVRAIILPDGRLGVFYRLRAPAGNGSSHYILGYTDRPVQVSAATPAPTATTRATATALATSTARPTLTPVPTPDLNTTTANPVQRRDLILIGEILAGMVVVVIVALIGLRLGQR